MKPLTDPMRQRLNAAMDYVLAQTEAKFTAKAIIEGLEKDHGAIFRYGSGSTYHLRCAGAAATNTAGDPNTILRAWRRNAVLRLSQIL